VILLCTGEGNSREKDNTHYCHYYCGHFISKRNTVTITVLSKTQLDYLLRSKWEGMKAAFALKDVQKAVSFFVAESKDRYSGIFTELGDTLPQVAQDMQNIKMIYSMGNLVQYRIKRAESAGLMTYYIFFVKEESDGIWRIQQF